MVTLKNKLRRMRVFNLDTPFFVKRRDVTQYGQPETLTLLALERREGVPDAVLSCTEVKAAIGQGNLRVYKQAEPASEPKAEAKPPTVELEPVPKPASEPEPKPVEPAKESKPEPMAEASKPIADSKPGPAEEAPKLEPKAEPKTKADAKPSSRKSTFRRHAKED